MPHIIEGGLETHNRSEEIQAIPLVDFQITQQTVYGTPRHFPDVGFIMEHKERQMPVKVNVSLDISNDSGQVYNVGGHYGGKKLWNLNPASKIGGHFNIPTEFIKNTNRISAVLKARIIDESGKEHDLLPMEWIYEIDKPQQGWWYNP